MTEMCRTDLQVHIMIIYTGYHNVIVNIQEKIRNIEKSSILLQTLFNVQQSKQSEKVNSDQ